MKMSIPRISELLPKIPIKVSPPQRHCTDYTHVTLRLPAGGLLHPGDEGGFRLRSGLMSVGKPSEKIAF